MSDVMSQEEIERMLAGLGGDSDDSASEPEPAPEPAPEPVTAESSEEPSTYSYPKNELEKNEVEVLPTEDYLSRDEQDLLGEIGNICMGTSATTMSMLLGRKVTITTPKISVQTVDSLSREYPAPLVVSEIKYVKGLDGDNLLILKEYDVALITNLMLGEDPYVDPDNIELNEIHMSAIGEVMNQMVGSSATALADLTHQVVDISTPETRKIELKEEGLSASFPDLNSDPFVKVSFTMEIEDLLTSEIMQILTVEFARELAGALWKQMQADMGMTEEPAPAPEPAQPASPEPQAAAPQQPVPEQAPPQQGQMPPQQMYPPQQGQIPPQQMYPPQMPPDQMYMQQPMGYPPGYGMPPMQGYPQYAMPQQHGVVQEAQNIQVQQPQFPSFSQPAAGVPNLENIEMILDVPMSVTVELGRTKKKIKEILEFNTGSVVVLDRPAGEMVDILVNGKVIGKGEVVVIDDNYGVRISEINMPNASELL